jgi:hypothetical protein
MEQDEYIAKAMFRADQREQLRYAEDKGIEKVFSLLEKGYSVDEAKELLAKREVLSELR